MSFLFTFLIALAMTVTVAMVAVRKFFWTNEAAGYVLVAINWTLLFLVTLGFTFLIKFIESWLTGT